MNQSRTVGELRASGWTYRPIKDELRDNLIARLRHGEPIFPGIVGFDDTVIPQVANALLARHDILFLGLRGQAKTRMIRMLPLLLDEWTPVLAGSDLPDNPLDPVFAPGRRIIAEAGDAASIRWVYRNDRYHEKLATPDVTVADLIGEIDLVKHAEGRHLTDEGVIHYGLVPRTNRGIFAINELPDLAPRIQVSLFNALEERDIQIRGFPIRLSLDIFMAFSANPEDYTNRGRIVTPLKDRIGSVVRTHYPVRVSEAVQITRQNAWLERDGDGRQIIVPPFMHEIIEEIARIARKSPHVNQQSGVSVRASICNAELLVSNAERRCIRFGETSVVPRISDLHHLVAGCRGKLELMLAEDERAEDKLITSIIGEAVKEVFDNHGELDQLEGVVDAFSDRSVSFEIGDEISTSQLIEVIDSLPALKKSSVKLCLSLELPFEEPQMLAAAAEFILESLYVNNRLSKYAYQGKTVFKR
ncbi:MAG: magnesium chelatase [Phycisphaerae bacterium]|nr:magnesium chelatase [Phycisphaerae bacterium]